MRFLHADVRIVKRQGASDIFLVEVLYGAGPQKEVDHGGPVGNWERRGR